MRPNETLLDSLLELQVLDRVPRTGFALRGVADGESVSEHSWHVAFLVWALSQREPDLDPLHALGLALIHDVAEVRLGDLPRTASRYLAREVKHAAERAAMQEILAPLGKRGVQLYDEYSRGETREARFVKACDKLQLMLKVSLYEGWGEGGLSEFWENPENFPDRGFETVDTVFDELQARRTAAG